MKERGDLTVTWSRAAKSFSSTVQMSRPMSGIAIIGSAVTADLSSLPVTCVSVLFFLFFAFPTHLRYLSEGWRMLYTRWEDSSTSYKFKGSLNLLVSLIQRTHTHTWESVFFPEMTSFNRAFPVKRKKWKWKARCDSRLSFDVHRWSLTDRFWMN